MGGMDRLQAQLAAAVAAQVEGRRRGPLPEAGRALWDAFCELAEARAHDGGRPQPIAWAELEAWARLMRWPLEPAHVRLLRAMDRAWLAAAEARREGGGKGKAPQRPVGQLTPEVFDAVIG